MSLNPQEIIENPCEEIIPVNPFPFKSHRISRSMKFFHYLIFFPFYVEYKKCKYLYTFNLETLEWSSVEFKGSPEILENSDNYAILSFLENQYVLFGCYKSPKTGQTNNLFSRSQETPQCVLGFIWTKLSEGQLTLTWEETKISQPIYLEKFSADVDNCSRELFVFGGYDENGNVSNQLYRIYLHSGHLENVKLFEEDHGTHNPIPARANHGSFYDLNQDSVIVIGGEDQGSNEMNDLWTICFSNSMMKNGQEKCAKWHRQTISRRPKLGTPCMLFNKLLFYIGKSSLEVIAPIRSYFCVEEFYEEPEGETQTYSSKKHLPFDGVPHTFEVFKDKLLIGFESSLYAIRIQQKNLAWSFDDDFGLKSFDSDGVSLVKRRQEASFKDHLRQYFVERPHPDISFSVKDEVIPAHRGILSVRSKYFNELFTCETTKDLKNPIEIEDLSPAAFTILLEWLYCNNVLEIKSESALELFKASEKYRVPKLKEEAEKTLTKSVTLDNVIEYAQFAIEHKAKELENAIVKLATKERAALSEREQLNLLPSSIIEKITKSTK